MTNSGQRIATATGVMLADPAELGRSPQGLQEAIFDPQFWAARGELAAVARGRGSAWFVGAGASRWVLRHYRRGGYMDLLSQDRYLWSGEQRVRSFAEWRLLAFLAQRGLPVPEPIAAWYRRSGLTYRCDLITRLIPDTQPLSAVLKSAPLQAITWREIGVVIARLHGAGVDHPDLTAHNILLDPANAISVVDFDRGELRAAGSWSARNVQRLRRSLDKVALDLPRDRFGRSEWDAFLAGYQAKV